MLDAGGLERVLVEHRDTGRQFTQAALAQLCRDHDLFERRVIRRGRKSNKQQ